MCQDLAKVNKSLRNKFVFLPDGLPVGLTFLIPDGKKSSLKEVFPLLPDAVQLWVLRQALAKEKREGKAWKNERLASEIRHLLESQGLSLPTRISERCLKDLRTRLNRVGLDPLFPAKKKRQEALSRRPPDASHLSAMMIPGV